VPKTARILLISIFSLLLLLGGAVALLESPWAKRWLVDQLGQSLAREVHVGELEFAWAWPPRVRLNDVRVANAPWAGPEPMLQARAIEAAVNPLSLLRGQLDLQRLHLEQPIVHLAQREQGAPNWRFGDDSGSDGAGLDVRIGALSIDQGRLSYRDPGPGTELHTQLSSFQDPQGQRRLRFQGQGRLQDAPLQFAATGAAPARLLEGEQPYPFDLEAEWGQTRIRFDGKVDRLRGMEGLQGQLRAQGPETADIARLLGAPALDLPAFALSGELSHRGEQWALRQFELQTAQSRLTGSASLIPGQTPRLEAKLQAQTLDLNEFGLAATGPAQEPAEREPPASWRARWAEHLAPLRRWSGEVALEVERLRYGEQELRDVTAAASLADHRLDIERLHFSAGDGQVEASGWAEVHPDDLTGALTADVHQVSVAELLGRPAAAGTVSGHLQARLTPDALQLADTRLRYQDPAAQTQVEARIETQAAANGQRLLVRGQGQYQGTPLQFELSGDDFAQALEGQAPYALSLAGQLGQTRVSWQGEVQRLAGLEGLRGRLQVTGQPPQGGSGFSVQGELSHSAGRWALSGLQAQAGGLGSVGGELQLSLGPQGLQLHDTRLDYRNPDLELRLELSVSTLDAAPAPRLHVEGTGVRRGRPFRFDLIGGPLLELIRPSQPYPVEGDIFSLDTAAHLDGTLTEPLRWQAADLDLWLKGPNPANLYPLLGLPLPTLPPYQLQGRLRWEGEIVRFTGFEGRVGDSDLSGDVRIRTGERPMLWATLASDHLDFDDLFPTVGAAPAIGGDETASAEQRRKAAREERKQGVFPTTPLSLERLHAMDAVVRFQGKEVRARALPLNDLRLVAELRSGVLRLEPLNFGLGGGDVTSSIRLDAREQPVRGLAELVVRGVNLKPLMERFDLAEDSFGVIGGEGDFRFAGNSIAEAMANLSGELELLMQGGRLDMFAVEVAGLDLGEALVAKLSRDDTVPLRCAYARFDATEGMARLERFFIDTSDTNFTGAGQVDLEQERLELVFEAHPKDFSLFALSSPVQLEGALSELGVDILSGEVAGRLALAVAAALIAPPAALLPLLDLGEGEDAGPGCEQVLAEARTDAG
jgi:uncharacterized protein involved in outer membrane biogenesis